MSTESELRAENTRLREALTALLAATDARGFGVLSYFDADAIAAARAAAAAVVEQP